MNIIRVFYIFFVVLYCGCRHEGINNSKNKLLVFTKTEGYRHESIQAGIEAVRKLGLANDFAPFFTEDAAVFSDSNLKNYKAVLFLNTTGNILNTAQEMAFTRFIRAGGGFAGVHAASDCEYQWPWYTGLVGGAFLSHPDIQTAQLLVTDTLHPATKLLPRVWQRTDEWYNFQNLSPTVNVLIKINESTYSGGTMGNNHPMAWYQQYDGGRSFYTALGHTKQSYTEANFLNHLLGGILYAMNL